MNNQRAVDFFSEMFYGEHHIPSAVKPFGAGWSVLFAGDISTFDFNFMTRLVFLSHDWCIRSSIMQGGPGTVKICIWQRVRGGGMTERHPTIEDALIEWRKKHAPEELEEAQKQQPTQKD